MFDEPLLNLARLLLDEAERRRVKIATAESCTGGLLSALLTEIPGSSKVFERGFVTYSNRAKEELLGVPGDLIADMGAVSEPVARAMAEGALANSRANLTVSITGVAGPDGGTPLKPIGLVHFACARENRSIRHVEMRFGDVGRRAIRAASLETALTLLREGIG
jgi:nicotinamide-nucleotide amidase